MYGKESVFFWDKIYPTLLEKKSNHYDPLALNFMPSVANTSSNLFFKIVFHK